MLGEMWKKFSKNLFKRDYHAGVHLLWPIVVLPVSSVLLWMSLEA
jgi:hypothetical protein